MSIAGHLSRGMVEHYSHIRMEAKRAALEAIAPVSDVGVAQDWAQLKEQEPDAAGKSLN